MLIVAASDKAYLWLQQCDFLEETAGKCLDERPNTLVIFSFLKDGPEHTNTHAKPTLWSSKKFKYRSAG